MDLIYEMDEVDGGGKIVKYEVQGTKYKKKKNLDSRIRNYEL